MMESEIVYIYGLIDPRINQLRYIGKSVSPKLRLRKHISERFKHDSYKDRWVRQLLDNNLRPELFIIDIVDKSEWVFWEQFYISYFKGLGFRLTNGTNGGDQPPSTKGRRHTKESKEKMSKSKKGKPIPWLNNDTPRTEKHKENLSKSLKGRISNKRDKSYVEIYGEEKAENLKNKLSESHKGLFVGDKHPMYGKHHSEESKKKIAEGLTLKVVQLSLDGTLIKIWDSIKEAQEVLKVGNISTVCKGKRKTSGGFKWKYLHEYE